MKEGRKRPVPASSRDARKGPSCWRCGCFLHFQLERIEEGKNCLFLHIHRSAQRQSRRRLQHESAYPRIEEIGRKPTPATRTTTHHQSPPLVSRCALKRYSRGGLMRVIRAPPPAYIRNFAGGWLLCSCRAKRPAAAQPGSALRGFRRPPNLTTPARIRHHVPRWRACSWQSSCKIYCS